MSKSTLCDDIFGILLLLGAGFFAHATLMPGESMDGLDDDEVRMFALLSVAAVGVPFE